MKFYTGFTKDLKLRFDRHNKGLVESTKDRRPLKLIYYEACLSQKDATKREKYLKSYLFGETVLAQQAQILFNRVKRAKVAFLRKSLSGFVTLRAALCMRQ